MSGYSALVTGSNRGIGLGLVKRLAENPDVRIVFAASRHPEASALIALAKKFDNKIVPIKLELEENSAATAARAVKEIVGAKGLDILINNAGTLNNYYGPISKTYYPDYRLLTASPPSDFKEVFDVNVVSMQIITQAFLPLLRAGTKKTIVNISSFLGSLKHTDGRYKEFAFHAYSLSKAAVNFLVRDYAVELAEEGFTVIAMNPGYVRTDMAPKGMLTVEESSGGIAKVALDPNTKNGEFYQWDGSQLPW